MRAYDPLPSRSRSSHFFSDGMADVLNKVKSFHDVGNLNHRLLPPLMDSFLNSLFVKTVERFN